MLPAVYKVFESLLGKQMIENYNTHLYNKMTAYRKTHICETTWISLTEHWRQAVDKKECVAALSTDMSKAFDSLHPALMIGNTSSLKLMRSFVSERFNRVKLNGKTSSWKHVTIGRGPRIVVRSTFVESLSKWVILPNQEWFAVHVRGWSSNIYIRGTHSLRPK